MIFELLNSDYTERSLDYHVTFGVLDVRQMVAVFDVGSLLK
jgi:uncharacterized surface protein with fasciclin (FAS1) repeats